MVSKTPNKKQDEGSCSTNRDGGHATSATSAVVDDHRRSENESRRHVCNVCGRGYESHQALGGHKTIHRVRAPPQHGGSELAPTRGEASRFGGRSHTCKKCGASFGTGQQLGGHMRKHNPLKKKQRNCDNVGTGSGSGGGGADVSREANGGGADVENPATEEIDLELRLGYKN